MAANRAIRGVVVAACLAMLAGVAAADVKLFDDGELALWGRENPGGVIEAAVATYYGGTLQGNFKVLEAYDKVPGVNSWPLTMVDLTANCYMRPTYQIADGSTGSLGTSVVGSFAYRSTSGFQYVPAGTSATVTTGGADRLRITRTGTFGGDASVSSTVTFPDPAIGSTTVSLVTQFTALNSISLDGANLGNDAFRLAGLSSMFAGSTVYDSQAIRWRDPAGNVHVTALSEATPRGLHLFASPIEIAPGGYFELVKTPGSTWYPNSPTIRVTLTGLSGITGRVGIQGWLAPTTDPNDDSLSLWLEWMDAPATIPSGASYEADFTITATPPSSVPEPGTAVILLLCGALVSGRMRQKGM